MSIRRCEDRWLGVAFTDQGDSGPQLGYLDSDGSGSNGQGFPEFVPEEGQERYETVQRKSFIIKIEFGGVCKQIDFAQV